MRCQIILDKSSFPKITVEQFNGSDCSGSDSQENRILTTSSAENAIGEIMVFVDGLMWRKTDNWTISGNDITLKRKIWNNQKIDIYYLE